MATGLNVSDFVAVSLTIEPLAAQYRNFGIGKILGSTPNIIDVGERRRYYTTLDAVAQDFGTVAPEYLAARLYFSQEPQPAALYVARWARTPTAGLLHGAVLSSAQQLLTNFTAVAAGSLRLSINGTSRDFTGIDLSGALNLNGVAQVIQTAITAVVSGVTVKWDAVQKRFTITSGLTGPTSSVGYGAYAGSGTDLSTILHITALDASEPVPGRNAETLTSCIAALADRFTDWYSLQVATVNPPSDADYLAAAQLIEGLGQSRIYGVTLTNANVLDPTSSGDLASLFKTLGLQRTYCQFSSTNPYAAESLFARAATVDFEASRSTITLAYKQEPGVVAENLTETNKITLDAKNVNYFANVNNGTAIVFPGKMSNGDYFDERHGGDWFQNRLQVDVYNLLYLTPTKVPQTDAGMDMIAAVIKLACEVGVENGLFAPGIWTGPPVGPIKTGDMLPKGYFVYTPPVASQSPADRAARKSVPFQVLCKLAGAVHLVSISVLLNR